MKIDWNLTGISCIIMLVILLLSIITPFSLTISSDKEEKLISSYDMILQICCEKNNLKADTYQLAQDIIYSLSIYDYYFRYSFKRKLEKVVLNHLKEKNPNKTKDFWIRFKTIHF